MTAEFFQTEFLQMEQSMYRASYSILRNDADCADAMQDALLHAWEKRTTLKRIECFRAWMMRILINCCYNTLRKRKRWILYPIDEIDEALIYTMPEPIALLEEIELLPSVLRLTIVLYYIDGYSVQEISDLTGTPTGTIKSRLKSGRDRLCMRIREEAAENVG